MLFRGLALLLPAGLLLCLELVLRALGFGYPVHFFVPAEKGVPGLYAENPRFGWQFFPRRLARAPNPIRLSAKKAAGTRRIFVFGESAALGDPEAAYSFSRILREVLDERCPGTKFEIVNVATTAINSHVIRRIARDCAAFEADLWIIYMGNNEVVGPFGAGSVFGAKAPPRAVVRFFTAARRICLGQVLAGLLESFRMRAHQLEHWEGMKMFLNERVRLDEPSLQRVYSSFRDNLNDIVASGERAGVKIILCSVSSNLRDCPPFASAPHDDLTHERKAAWINLVQAGIEHESAGQLAEALAKYQQAAEIEASDAVLWFRMARCYDATGALVAAHEAYVRARDLDTLRFRPDTMITQILSNVCARGTAERSYFDADKVIQNASPGGIPGAEFFWDHVHFNFAGNYRVACGLAEKIISQLDLVSQANGRVLSEPECAERLALTDWDHLQVLDQMWRRVNEPPFTDQLNHKELVQRWSKLRSELQRKTDAAGLAKAAEIYRRALARRPEDWVLHHRGGLLLEAMGDLAGAEEHWRQVLRRVPGYPDAAFKLGEICFAKSRLQEAAEYYGRVLQVRPDSWEALNGLGLVRMSQDRLAEAADLFEQAIRKNRKFTQAHVNLGLLCARRGSVTDAEAHYREAIKGDPLGAAAHINLGNLLAAQQRHAEAVSHYTEALKARPASATIHFSIGNSLAALGRHSDALAQYRAAVDLDPVLPEAQFNLGLAMARSGDLAGATICFKEAARLRPADPQAHLNLGVALARQGQLGDAISEFEAVLRLDPANETARQYLRTATARRHSQAPETGRN